MSAFEPRRLPAVWAAILLPAAASLLAAQAPPSGAAAGTSSPILLPQSGRTSSAGSVTVQQSTSPSGTDTVQTSVQVGGDVEGSVPGAKTPEGAISLSLSDAVRLGLKNNLGTLASGYASAAARAQRAQALSALLPYISIGANDTLAETDLAAYGFKFTLPANSGFSIPTIVGPYNYSQLQATVSQSIYDPVARRNARVTEQTEKASILSAKDARELVVLAVGSTYLQILATSARIESQRAQVASAQAVYDQANIRKQAGTNAKIDVMRTLVELQSEKQRLNSLESDLRTQKLTLARAIGLPLDREIYLTEALAPNAIPIPAPETAIEQAFAQRSDLKAAQTQVRAAEIAVDAARAQRLPSASVSGDFGVLGSDPIHTHGVFSVTGSVSVPVFTGGRIKADIEQAQATLDQRRAELADQRGRVEQEVRTALIQLQAASGQLDLAASNREYAAETLREARDRFSLGVTNTVEVVQAQQQVASAEADYVSSLLAVDVARLNLSRAAGEAESALPDLLKGKR